MAAASSSASAAAPAEAVDIEVGTPPSSVVVAGKDPEKAPELVMQKQEEEIAFGNPPKRAPPEVSSPKPTKRQIIFSTPVFNKTDAPPAVQFTDDKKSFSLVIPFDHDYEHQRLLMTAITWSDRWKNVEGITLRCELPNAEKGIFLTGLTSSAEEAEELSRVMTIVAEETMAFLDWEFNKFGCAQTLEGGMLWDREVIIELKDFKMGTGAFEPHVLSAQRNKTLPDMNEALEAARKEEEEKNDKWKKEGDNWW